jgi:uncharacterized protein
LLVGVLSDTHLSRTSDSRPLTRIVQAEFRECDAVLHAGDLVDLDTVTAAIPDGIPLYAVAGNMDDGDSAELPVSRIVKLGAFRIGLVHTYGSPESTAKKALQLFSGQNVDAVVFGHSHSPVCRYESGVLLFNPGSVFHPRGRTGGTVGILELDDRIEGRIIQITG